MSLGSTWQEKKNKKGLGGRWQEERQRKQKTEELKPLADQAAKMSAAAAKESASLKEANNHSSFSNIKHGGGAGRIQPDYIHGTPVGLPLPGDQKTNIHLPGKKAEEVTGAMSKEERLRVLSENSYDQPLTWEHIHRWKAVEKNAEREAYGDIPKEERAENVVAKSIYDNYLKARRFTDEGFPEGSPGTPKTGTHEQRLMRAPLEELTLQDKEEREKMLSERIKNLPDETDLYGGGNGAYLNSSTRKLKDNFEAHKKRVVGQMRDTTAAKEEDEMKYFAAYQNAEDFQEKSSVGVGRFSEDALERILFAFVPVGKTETERRADVKIINPGNRAENLISGLGSYWKAYQNAQRMGVNAFQADSEEARIYNYLWNIGKGEEAERFYELAEKGLYARTGAEMADTIDGMTPLEIGAGLPIGILGVGDSIQAAVDSIGAKEWDPEAYKTQHSLPYYMGNQIYENLEDEGPKVLGRSLGQWGYDATNNTGRMLPSLAMNAVLPGSGAVVMGVQSYGDAYQEAIESGKTVGEARNYGLLVGASETTLEYLLSGAGNMVGKVTGRSLKSSLDKIDNVLLRAATDMGERAVGEFSEEYLQEVLDPVFRNICFDENNEFKPFSEDALYSGIMGALTSTGMSSVSAPFEMNAKRSMGKDIKASGLEGYVQEMAAQFPEDSYLGRMSGKESLSNTQLGEIYAQLGEEGANLGDLNAGLALYRTMKNQEKADKKSRRAGDKTEGTAAGNTAERFQAGQAGSSDEGALHSEGSSGQFSREDVLEAKNRIREAGQYESREGTAKQNQAYTPKQGTVGVSKNVKSANVVLKEDNTPMVVTGIAKVEDGDLVLQTSDGKQVKRKEVSFENKYVDMEYLRALTLGNPDLSKAYIDNLADVKAEAYPDYLDALRKFHKAGMEGKDLYEMLKSDPLTETFSWKALGDAYRAGAKYEENLHSISQKKLIKRLARERGMQVEFYKDDFTSNGYYENGVIHINEKSESPYLSVMGHELTHKLKVENTEAYENLRDTVISYLKETDQYEERLMEIENRYIEQNEDFNEEDAMEEMTANACSDFLLDERVVEQLAVKDKNVIQKVLDAIKRLIAKIRDELRDYASDSYEAYMLRQNLDVLEQAKEIWTDGLKTAEETEANGEVKFSIKETKGGRQYVEVDTAQELFEGKDNSEYGKVAEGIIRKMFQGKVVGDGENRTFVNGKTRREYVFPPKRIDNAEAYNGKMKAAPELDNLVKASRYVGHKEDGANGHYHENNAGGFDYYETIFHVDGKFYRGIINVEITKRGKLLKDITKIEEVSSSMMSQSENEKYISQGTSSIDSITVSAENINKKNSENENGENDKGEKWSLKLSYDKKEVERNVLLKSPHMQKAVQAVENGMDLSRGHVEAVLTDEGLRGMAEGFIKKYDSDYDSGRLVKRMQEYFAYVNEGDFSAAQRIAMGAEVLKPVLERSRKLDRKLWKQYEPMRTFFATEGISLSKAQRDVVERMFMTNYERFKSGQAGSFTLDENGKSLNYFWEALCEEYPEFFDREADDREKVLQVLDAIDAVQPRLKNDVGYDIEKGALEAAMEMYADVIGSNSFAERSDMRTHFADKIRENIKEARKRSRESYQSTLRKIQERNLRRSYQEGLTKEGAPDYREEAVSEALAVVRSSGRNQIRIKNEQTASRERIKKNVKSLVKWMESPTESRHIPDSIKPKLLEAVAGFDYLSDRAKRDSLNSQEWEYRMRELADWAAEMEKKAAENEAVAGKASDGAILSVYMDFPDDFVKRLSEFNKKMNKKRLEWDKKDWENERQKEKENPTKLYNMSLEEIQEMDFIVNAFRSGIAKSNELRANERHKKVEELGEASIREMQEVKKRAAGSALKTMNVDMVDPIVFFERMGPAAKSVFDSFVEGFNERVRLLAEAKDYTDVLLKDKKLVKRCRENTEAVTVGTENGPVQVQMTHAQIMELCLLAEQEDSLPHLKSGFELSFLKKGKDADGKRLRNLDQHKKYHLRESDITALRQMLTKEERNVMYGMRAFLADNCAGWGNKVTQALWETDKYKNPIYWPIRTAAAYNKTNDKNAGGDVSLYRIGCPGFAHERIDQASNPLVVGDAFDTYSRHIMEMANYSAYKLPISDAMRWLNYSTQQDVEISYGKESEPGRDYSSVKAAMKNLYDGKDGNKRIAEAYIIQLIKDINGDQGNAENDLGLDKWVGNFKAAAVAFNPRVVIQQPTAIIRAAELVDVKYLAKARRTDGVSGGEKARKYCPIALWKSWGFYESGLSNSYKNVLLGEQTLRDKVVDKTMAGAEAADNVTWGIIWNACEAECRDKYNLTGEALYKKTAERMTEVVLKTQVVDSVLTKCPLLRSKNWLVKSQMAFMSEPMKSYNMLVRAVDEFFATGKVNKKAAATALLKSANIYLVQAFVNAVAQSVIDAERDDDETKDYLEAFFDALWGEKRDFFGGNFFDNLNPLNMHPVAKTAVSALSGFQNERSELDFIYELATFEKKASKWFSDEEYREDTPFYSIASVLLSGISKVTGLPFSSVSREVTNALNQISRAVGGSNLIVTNKYTYKEKYERIADYQERGKYEKAEKIKKWLRKQGKTEKEIQNGIKRAKEARQKK